jgi:hypothetical protein
MLVVSFTSVEMQLTSRSLMHGGEFYRVLAMVVPLVLAGVARASGRRWAATIVAGVYSLFYLALSWILPLFPAAPKLGPVYIPITHFVPPEFPILLIVPAIVLDLLWTRLAHWNKWLLAAISGVVFVGVLFAAQWPFADFLMSPAARNWFFGAKYFDYGTPPTSLYFRHLYYMEPLGTFPKEMALAVVFAILMTRIGLAWGSWMQRIRR